MPRRIPLIDLVYDWDCPNAPEARALLRVALTQLNLPADWREWERDGNETPPDLRGLGSPTILVNGIDVSPIDHEVSERAKCCRLYHYEGRLRGVPEIGLVTSAIQRYMGEA